MRKAIQNTLLLAVSLVVACVASEALYRLWLGEPLLEFKNIPVTRAIETEARTTEYDDRLGWRMTSNTSSLFFGTLMQSTLDYGIRRNGNGDDKVRVGGVVAVGDSFVAGSEGSDHESWPAALERRLSMPVINGAVGAYGTDQIIMRAEQLLPLIKPKILLIGMLEADIDRAGYQSFGKPKPYFTLEGGQLTLNNVPVPVLPPGGVDVVWWKRILAHFYLADRVMLEINGPLWYQQAQEKFVRVANDQVAVTCRLLQRIKRQTDADGVRTLLVMQHGGEIIRQFDAPRPQATQVQECARLIGIQVVDEFPALKAIQRQGPTALNPYYFMHGEQYGHMSAKGNELIASLIEAALHEATPSGVAENYAPAAFVPGDGKNLLPNSETLETLVGPSTIATLASAGGAAGPFHTYRLSAAGAAGEHYVIIRPLPADAGPYTLSLEMKADSTGCINLQIIDKDSNGVLADVNLGAGTIGAMPIGNGREIGGGIAPAGDGWYRVWVTARLPSSGPITFLQPADAGCNRSFSPDGEALLLRKIQFERGQSASAYNATP